MAGPVCGPSGPPERPPAAGPAERPSGPEETPAAVAGPPERPAGPAERPATDASVEASIDSQAARAAIAPTDGQPGGEAAAEKKRGRTKGEIGTVEDDTAGASPNPKKAVVRRTSALCASLHLVALQSLTSSCCLSAASESTEGRHIVHRRGGVRCSWLCREVR